MRPARNVAARSRLVSAAMRSMRCDDRAGRTRTAASVATATPMIHPSTRPGTADAGAGTSAPSMKARISVLTAAANRGPRFPLNRMVVTKTNARVTLQTVEPDASVPAASRAAPTTPIHA